MNIKTFVLISLIIFSSFSQINETKLQNAINHYKDSLLTLPKEYDSIPKEFQINLNVVIAQTENEKKLIGQNMGKIFSNRIRLNNEEFPVYKVLTGFFNNKFSCVIFSGLDILIIQPYLDKKNIDISSIENIAVNSILNDLKWIVYFVNGTMLYIN